MESGVSKEISGFRDSPDGAQGRGLRQARSDDDDVARVKGGEEERQRVQVRDSK